jgi:hypothetical protein
MLDTGTQLVTHINGLEQNIAVIDRVAGDLPWKTQRNDWWGKWVDGYRYRGIEQAWSRLEHLRVYVNVVRGMVTSELLALKEGSFERLVEWSCWIGWNVRIMIKRKFYTWMDIRRAVSR